MKQQSKQEGCWHSHYFTKIEVNSEEIQSLAFRLNEVALTHLNKNADRTLFVDGLTHDQWLNLLNEKLNFLKENRKKASSIDFRNGLGSTAQFLCDGGRCNPMGIRDEKDEQLYKNALKLDCSDSAKSCAWIYRGGDFQKDSLVSWDNENRPYSLSYGTSAFAGCIFDPTATAMYYMQKRDTPNAYAIPIRFKDLADSPFYVPNSHTLVQLCSDGEVFHARTKAWKNFNPKDMGGFNLGVDGGERSHLKSELTREDLMKKFIQYKAVAIQLK